MSVVYRVVKRSVGHMECKELTRGIVNALRDVMDNVPVIIVNRTNRPRANVYVYEVQVWTYDANGVGSWMWYMPIDPWSAAHTQISLNACLLDSDIPLVTDDLPSLTFHDVPLAGMDVPALPRVITPAVTYI